MNGVFFSAVCYHGSLHPGEMLLEEFLKPLGVSQKEFAVHLGWT